jgi:hypothetical protein
MTMASNASTTKVMIVIAGIRMMLWNQAASSPIGVNWSWRAARPSGWPMPGSAVACEAALDRATWASSGGSCGALARPGELASSGCAGRAWDCALIASVGPARPGAACAAGCGAAVGCALAATGARPSAAAKAASLKMVFI